MREPDPDHIILAKSTQYRPTRINIGAYDERVCEKPCPTVAILAQHIYPNLGDGFRPLRLSGSCKAEVHVERQDILQRGVGGQ